jgi:hypothetical protein
MRVEQAPNIAQRTFEFAVSVVPFCKVLDSKPGINWVLGRQLLRSGMSIGATGSTGGPKLGGLYQ